MAFEWVYSLCDWALESVGNICMLRGDADTWAKMAELSGLTEDSIGMTMTLSQSDGCAKVYQGPKVEQPAVRTLYPNPCPDPNARDAHTLNPRADYHTAS